MEDNLFKKILKEIKKEIIGVGRGLVALFYALPKLLLLASVVLFFLSLFWLNGVKSSQYHQYFSSNWATKGNRYSQFSLFSLGQPQTDNSLARFINAKWSLSVSEIKTLNTFIDEQVKELLESADPKNQKETTQPSNEDHTNSTDSQSENTSLNVSPSWLYSYSAEQVLPFTRAATELAPEANAEVMVTGVGGDYFLFHPWTLLSGNYISEQDVDSQRVVLDHSLAWTLFGSVDVIGREVKIDGKIFTVAGVVEVLDDKINKPAYGSKPRAYVLFSVLAKEPKKEGDNAGGGNRFSMSDANGSNTDSNLYQGSDLYAVTTYEILLPNVVKGFAKQIFLGGLEKIGKSEDQLYVVENSHRFDVFSLKSKYWPLGMREVKANSFALPFYEMAAVRSEQYSVLYICCLFISGVGFVVSISAVIFQWRRIRLAGRIKRIK